MADTTFVDLETLIEASWLNDVNDLVYGAFNGANTPSAAKTALGVPASPVGTTDTQTLTNKTIDGNENTLLNVGGVSFQTTNVTITVGTTGDYETLNEAVKAAAEYFPAYVSTGVTVTINLLTGFVMDEQVIVHGLDLGWVTITAADATVMVASTAFDSDLTITAAFVTLKPLFGGVGGCAVPKLDAIFDMANVPTVSGAMGLGLLGGSSGVLTRGSGIKNSVRGNVYCGDGSSASSYQGVFSGVRESGFAGIRVSNASLGSFSGADVTACASHGARCDAASQLNMQGADATGAGYQGFSVGAGGILNAGGATGTLSQTANTITADGIIFQEELVL